MGREENPFADPQGAREWIVTVENERNGVRDKEIYPQLAAWIQSVRPNSVADIGAGQGIASSKLGSDVVRYIGIDPSETLIERAKEIYSAPNRIFVAGNAYALPLKDGEVDAAFSITTWFHLADLDTGSRELARILKPGGHFMIITPNPNAYALWESLYINPHRDGKLLTGAVDILLEKTDTGEEKYSRLSKNTFYFHTRDELLEPLAAHGLVVDKLEELGNLSTTRQEHIFIKILGHKN